MSKKKKIIIAVLTVCMILTIVIGYTYALWTVRKEQTGMNTVDSGCLNITFTEADDINLENSYPMTNQEGLLTKPYTFTIENTCDLFANYQINLETFDAPTGKTRMPDSYMKVNLKQVYANKFLDTLKEENKVETTIEGATDAYKLITGVLKGKATKTYNLRIWMDESVTQYDEGAVNSYFNSKISVVFVAAVDPFAESGTLQAVPYSSYNYKFWTYRSKITEVEFQNKMEPIVDAIESWDVSATEDGSVMAYMVENGVTTDSSNNEITAYKVYIQGKDGVKANPNSSNLFYYFNKLTEIKGLEYFDTSNVTNMSQMFSLIGSRNPNFIMDISDFDTSNVTTMYRMFEGVGFDNRSLILDFSNWDTSSVSDMSFMFDGAFCSYIDFESYYDFNIDFKNTSNVTNMAYMFRHTGIVYESSSRDDTYSHSKKINLNLINFDTSNVTNMSYMFFNCGFEKLDLQLFNTSNVTNMSNMFYQVGYKSTNFVLDLSNFDTSNVTDMSAMFSYAGKYNSELFALDLSSFNTSNVTNMSEMFYSTGNNSQSFALDLSSFDTSNVTNMRLMFCNCESLEELDLSNFNTSSVTDMSSMFSRVGYKKRNLTLNLSSFNTSHVTDMHNMFYSTGYNSEIFELDLSNFDTSNVTNMAEMFQLTGNKSLNFTLNVSSFDTSNVTNMSRMFDETASSSETFNLDVSNFNTSRVTNMTRMFAEHKNLVLTLGNAFNTSNVTKMGGLFYGNKSLTVNNIDVINTSSVEEFDYAYSYYVYGLFAGCENVNLTFTILTNNITNIKNTFSNAATAPSSQITVNYTSENEALVDQMIATKSATSNVVKGTMLPNYNIVLDSSYDEIVNLNVTSGYQGKKVVLSSVDTNKFIKSFKLDGVEMAGSVFTIPNKDVTITDVVLIDKVVVESQHNNYLNNENYTVYYENTFEGATYITVELTYQTEGTNYDWVYLYTSPTGIYQNKKYGGTTLKTETITIPGNYLKIIFKTDSMINNYYGFKAAITPNYD